MLLIAVAVLALLVFPVGCAATISGTRVGSSSDQSLERITDNNPSQAQVRMVDAERGTLSAQGIGSSTYTSLNSAGIEKMATGTTPRELLYDGRTFVLSSGTDVTAQDVDITRDPDGSVRVKVGKFGTISSASQEALAVLMRPWVDRLKTMDAASLEALKAEVQAWEAIAPDLKSGIVSIIEAVIAGGL
ncbi:MAG: hypothetical protein AMXMBFR58_29490 [Phycisphaerae bacterium]